MRRSTMANICILTTFFFLPVATSGQRHHAAASAALTAPTSACPADITGIADCPESGCGENGDQELNKAKNKVDVPKDGDVQKATFSSMTALAQPAHWDTGQDRSSIRGAGKEGTSAVLKGFLLKVKAEGGESCNCDLTRRVDTDVHLALVSASEDGEETSVTAELTPRLRANGHTSWLYKDVKDLEGEYVRVTGWLMLDTKHIPQSHLLPNERHNKAVVRATNWEVHPVTKLEVCQKSVTACNANQGWEEF